MRQICKFCKETDLQVHVPALHTDIAKAIENGGVINGSVPTDFNLMDIEHAENATRLREPFDALDYNATLTQASVSFSSGTGNVLTSSSSTADTQ